MKFTTVDKGQKNIKSIPKKWTKNCPILPIKWVRCKKNKLDSVCNNVPFFDLNFLWQNQAKHFVHLFYRIEGMIFFFFFKLDNDKYSANCAFKAPVGNRGGWWFNKCTRSNLNGLNYAYGTLKLRFSTTYVNYVNVNYSVKIQLLIVNIYFIFMSSQMVFVNNQLYWYFFVLCWF